jgi:hypothetical protein
MVKLRQFAGLRGFLSTFERGDSPLVATRWPPGGRWWSFVRVLLFAASSRSLTQVVRYKELGIREAIRQHSGAGKEPRPSRVANNRKRYNIENGWFDPDKSKFTHSGTLINCQYQSRAVLPI